MLAVYIDKHKKYTRGTIMLFFHRSILITAVLVSGCAKMGNHKLGDLYEPNHSNVIISEDSVQTYLRKCEVIKRQDSLMLYFSDTVMYSGYELEIIKTSDSVFSYLRGSLAILDSSYKPPTFKIIEQKISIEKNDHSIGDSFEGNIFLKVISYNKWPAVYTDTLTVEGDFSAVVK